MVGSTECALIWREKTSPAGFAISRLAPWTPPTSGKGSGGSPWNTPQAMDGNKGSLGPRPHDTGVSLPQQIAGTVGQWPTPTLADVQGGRKTRSGKRSNEMLLNGLLTSPWVTPSARDWKDSAGMATTAVNPDGSTRARTDQLPRQMAATAAPGQTTNGSSATTAKRGAPNPDFAFWLMGWPDEFRRGVLRAIASLPSSRRKSSPPTSTPSVFD